MIDSVQQGRRRQHDGSLQVFQLRQTEVILTVWQICAVAETFRFRSLSGEFGDMCVTKLVTQLSAVLFSKANHPELLLRCFEV